MNKWIQKWPKRRLFVPKFLRISILRESKNRKTEYKWIACETQAYMKGTINSLVG